MSNITKLLIPFELKDEIRKEFKIKWDSDKKIWKYIGELPEGLVKYQMKYLDIPYEVKDEWKAKLKSMKWVATEKCWAVNFDDYKLYMEK